MVKKANYLLRKKFRAKPKPIIPLGPYTKPRVVAIKLDPEQALITSCRVGGNYMIGGGAMCMHNDNFHATGCSRFVRGVGTAKRGSAVDASTPPS